MSHEAPRHMTAFADAAGDLLGYWFWCPACEENHPFHVGGEKRWAFDGNMEAPTFTPSLRVLGRGKRGDSDANRTSCHLFVTAGEIVYCGDCPHDHAGRVIALVPEPPLADEPNG